MVRYRTVLFLLTLVCASASFGRGASSVVFGVESAGDVALFTALDSICRTDGTAAGTVCHPVHPSPYDAPVLLNGRLYTLADSEKPALFAFDGKSAPARAWRFSPCYDVRDLTTNGRELLALARYQFDDEPLYVIRSDGTADGTDFVKEIPSRDAEIFARAGDAVLLRLRVPDGQGSKEVWWTSDGTVKGTHLLFPRAATFLTNVGRIALFADGNYLWRTDGTSKGTFVLMEEWTPTPIAVRDGVAWFTASRQVWRTDGTFAMPLRKVDFDPAAMGVTGTRLLFLEKQEHAVVVWGANEAYGIPTPIETIPIETSSVVMPSSIAHTGSLAFFTIGNGTQTEVWRSDGTREGTFRVAKYVSAERFVRFGEKMIFLADDGLHGREPWITDGTREGTFLLANLAAEGVLRGRVTDRKTGLPVANAIVTVDDGRDFPPARTGDDGRYTIEGIVGTHTIEAGGTFHRALAQDITIDANEEETLDFALRPGARIAGRVVDANGKPIAGAKVTLRSDVGVPFFLVTDQAGRFESDAIWSEAPWWVEADGVAGYNSATSGEIRLTPGETREVELTMRAYGRLRVRFIDAVSHAPVPTPLYGGALLETPKGAFSGISTLDSPVIEFAQPDGEYLLHSGLSSYRDAWYGSPIRIVAGTTQTIDFVVEPRGVGIRGIIRDTETGTRVPNVFVYLYIRPNARQQFRTNGGVFETQPTLADGRYRLRVESGWNSPYLPFETEIDVRFAENPRPEVEIFLTRGGTLRGRVVDAHGTPLSGVRVEVTPQQRVDFTDARGYYALTALPTETYTVTATRAGFGETRATVTVTAGKKATLDLTMAFWN